MLDGYSRLGLRAVVIPVSMAWQLNGGNFYLTLVMQSLSMP